MHFTTFQNHGLESQPACKQLAESWHGQVFTTATNENYAFQSSLDRQNLVCSVRFVDTPFPKGLDFYVAPQADNLMPTLAIEFVDYERQRILVFDSSHFPLQVNSEIEISDDSSKGEALHAVDEVLRKFDELGFNGVEEYLSCMQRYFIPEDSTVKEKVSTSLEMFDSQFRFNSNCHHIKYVAKNSLGGRLTSEFIVELEPGHYIEDFIDGVYRHCQGNGFDRTLAYMASRIDYHRILEVNYSPLLAELESLLFRDPKRVKSWWVSDAHSDFAHDDFHPIAMAYKGCQPLRWNLPNPDGLVVDVQAYLDSSLQGEIWVLTSTGDRFEIAPGLLKEHSENPAGVSRIFERIERAGFDELLELSKGWGGAFSGRQRTMCAAAALYDAGKSFRYHKSPTFSRDAKSVKVCFHVVDVDVEFAFHWGQDFASQITASWERLYPAPLSWITGLSGKRKFQVQLPVRDCLELVNTVSQYFNESSKHAGRASFLAQMLQNY